jgi:hypothetical protein
VTVCRWPKCGYYVVDRYENDCYYHAKVRDGLIVPEVKRVVARRAAA